MPKPVETPIPTLREALGFFVRLVHLIRPYWRGLVSSIVLGILLTALSLIVPYMSKLLIDRVYPSRDVALMHVVVAAGLGLALSLALGGVIRGYYSTVVSTRLSSATLLMFFNHLMHLPTRFYDTHRVGEIMSRFADVRSSLGAVARVMETVLATGMHLVLVPPILLLIDWRLAAVAMIPIPIHAVLTITSARVTRKYAKRAAEASAELNAIEHEALTHARTIKTLSLERPTFQRALSQSESAMAVQLRGGLYSQLFGLASGMFSALGTALLTWYSWSLILRGELTIGDSIAFSAYSGQLFLPVGRWIGLVSGAQQTAVQLGRMFEYLDAVPEQDPTRAYAASTSTLDATHGAIALKSVSFAYDEGRPVLHGVSIDLPESSFTAIVGPSGAGKSTLLRLLCGLESPTAGRILVGGIPVSDIIQLRRRVGVVWQDAALFRGTVRENLTLGDESFCDEAIYAAMRLCRVEEVVATLSDGLETQVAEWGATVSAGQRQRIALARVVLREPSVVLLDEVTANLDLLTESRVLSGLLPWLSARTTVMVTHRVITASMAQQIVVIENGCVVGQGEHAQLVSTCELYRQMHEMAVETGDSVRQARRFTVAGR